MWVWGTGFPHQALDAELQKTFNAIDVNQSGCLTLILLKYIHLHFASLHSCVHVHTPKTFMVVVQHLNNFDGLIVIPLLIKMTMF